MERMGYILFEAFTLLTIISFTKGVLYLRRGPGRHRFLCRADREALFQPISVTSTPPIRLIRYTVITLGVMSASAVEIAILSQFGAAIVTGSLLITSAAIVQLGLSGS
jgi:uncharacterized membrane protein